MILSIWAKYHHLLEGKKAPENAFWWQNDDWAVSLVEINFLWSFVQNG